MNYIAREILDILGVSDEIDILKHYGVARRSGRYPWGSGENPYQHSGDFLSRVEELRAQGMTEKQIADAIGLTTTELRVQKSLAKDERRSLEVATAKGLKEKGYGINEIARRMGKNESSVRSLLNEHSEERMNQAKNAAAFLKAEIDRKGMVDVGAGVENQLHISKEKLKEALYILQREGYPVYGGGVAQVTNPGKQTILKVACPPGTEHRDIYALTNPAVKKRLLQSFADDCDAAAVHLKAAALPRQKYQVILPLTSIKDNEVYAPYLPNGETVALVRFPHGGTFEIPILKVNNKVREGIDILGKTPKDAIGINSKVAEQLSGADFDGDTVMVIPCNSASSNVRIKSRPPLEGLKDFDPKMEYPERPGMKYMKNTQTEMGKISNLITDMTLKGATDDELAKAVRHSMVVIDAEKHKLDYKQSEIDNCIKTLKRKYQGTVDDEGKYHEGASTLLSRAKSETSVLKRQGTPKVNQQGKPWYDPSKPEGALIFHEVREEYTDARGKTQVRTQRSTKMMETDDAFKLVSDLDTPAERAYATYANQMKALANAARKEMVSTGRIEYSKQAHATYQAEADTLEAKLRLALANAPRERQAQVMANATIAAKKQEYPDMTKSELKKAKNRALLEARLKVGSKRNPIDITDREWEAIQAGAISENKLSQILNHTDLDKLRERATPRTRTELSSAKISRIRALKASGYTIDEIAQAVGVSSSTVVKNMNAKE